jgi:hypothetical protein
MTGQNHIMEKQHLSETMTTRSMYVYIQFKSIRDEKKTENSGVGYLVDLIVERHMYNRKLWKTTVCSHNYYQIKPLPLKKFIFN